MRRLLVPIAVALGALALAPAAARAESPYPWDTRVQSAGSFADTREGRVAFAVVDETGRVRGRRIHERHYSASVVKAMLMVAYLNQKAVASRSLVAADKKLLKPMITRSDNAAASRVRNIVGNSALQQLGRRVRMKDLVTNPNWGDTRTSAYDQALLFRKIDLLVPQRHREYALKLLASIVPEQRWGLPEALPAGWSIFFKGGWRKRLVNQVALLRKDRLRISIAVLTDADPSEEYGQQTVRGIGERLIEGIEQVLPAPAEP